MSTWCSPAHARDAVVASFDGTPIVAHFYGAAGQPAGARAPTVLAGPGYPHEGDKRPDLDSSDALGAATLRAAGYNVLTWDPRGLGRSGGVVMFNSPAFEARDVSALIDFVSAQPEALLDAAGDPRVGMSGSSYGGAIQFVSAAIDRRIDAIVPDLAWHSLPTSLFRDGAVKTGWMTLICGGGEAAALTGGLFFGPAGLQLGGTATELKRVCLEALAGGAISPASRHWLADRGPGDLVGRIRAPTLITQGMVDILFPLGEAVANYDLLRRNGVAVKMLWHCGGHGICGPPRGDPRYVARAGLAWFARWLKRDVGVDTGAPFEWIGDDGVWRAGPDYPLAPAGTLDATGDGSLEILPLDGISLRPAPPTPSADRAAAHFAPPTSATDVIGEPLVKLAYRGTAVPAHTFLYAQIVEGGRVVGNQATPIPVVLDGRTHTVQRRLETLALRAGPASNLRLQVTSGTPTYGPQRSLGTVHLQSIQASLPLVDVTRSGRAPSTAVARRIPPRLRIRVSSRRQRHNSRIELRSTLRSRPCSGTVRFTIRSGSIRRVVRAPVAPDCAIRALLRLGTRAGRYRVSALFEGNDRLTPRRARSVVRWLR